MAFKIILLSGPICSGKTKLAKRLCERYGATLFKTNELLEKEIEVSGKIHRGNLQIYGEKLDKKDGGQWVAEALAKEINKRELSNGIVIIDSIRIGGQAKNIRKTFGSKGTGIGSQVYHIHVTAEKSTLEKRYKRRKAKFKEFESYADAIKNKTEKRVERLADISDVLIKTDDIEASDVLIIAGAHLNLYPRTVVPLVDVLIGGQYGSEGKGHIAAHIAPEYDCLMRVGGPNAGHKVYEKIHRKKDIKTFHHLPSGTIRNQDAKIVLGAGAVIRLPVLEEEIRFTEITSDRLFIDNRAMIIEDEDIEKENAEGNLVDNIGSTGQGVGSATARKILNRNPGGDVRLASAHP